MTELESLMICFLISFQQLLPESSCSCIRDEYEWIFADSRASECFSGVVFKKTCCSRPVVSVHWMLVPVDLIRFCLPPRGDTWSLFWVLPHRSHHYTAPPDARQTHGLPNVVRLCQEDFSDDFHIELEMNLSQRSAFFLLFGARLPSTGQAGESCCGLRLII